MISPEMTTELKEILFQEFGKDVSLAEVSNLGNALLGYASLLTKMNKEIKSNDKKEGNHE